jgi:hypothetical protein
MKEDEMRRDLKRDRVDRRTLLRAGLTTGLGVAALGATVLTGAKSPDLELRSFVRQYGWAHCKNCQGLSYAGALWAGVCPKTGTAHLASGSLPYFLTYSEDDHHETWDRQNQWKHCKRCQGLAYNGQGLLGWCPAGGHHDHSGSKDYFLWHDSNTPIYRQREWTFCGKCMALFYGPGQAMSACGQSGQHSGPVYPPSFDYSLEYDCQSPNGCRWLPVDGIGAGVGVSAVLIAVVATGPSKAIRR